jgi:hypothetical protein
MFGSNEFIVQGSTYQVLRVLKSILDRLQHIKKLNIELTGYTWKISDDGEDGHGVSSKRCEKTETFHELMDIIKTLSFRSLLVLKVFAASYPDSSLAGFNRLRTVWKTMRSFPGRVRYLFVPEAKTYCGDQVTFVPVTKKYFDDIATALNS